MIGKYIGIQAIIRQGNLDDYVPCAAYSLNLVGQSAAGCCQLGAGFFDFLRSLYSFFVFSTYRWKLLNDQLVNKGKRMSDTRWSARKDVTNALIIGYDEIYDALEGIVEDVEQKADTRQNPVDSHPT